MEEPLISTWKRLWDLDLSVQLPERTDGKVVPTVMLHAATSDRIVAAELPKHQVKVPLAVSPLFESHGSASDSDFLSTDENESYRSVYSTPTSSPSVDPRHGNRHGSIISSSAEQEDDDAHTAENRTARILAAVEFYFTDEQVAKDPFMYRHIMRGKTGFVNMKLIASFRKVKNITKDWTVVRDAVKSSSVLELNEEGTKVKRRIPFSANVNPLAKCVLAYNLGAKPSMGGVEQHLEQYGRICKISLFFPGQAVPHEVRNQCTGLDIALTGPLAVVELSTAEEARKAVTEIGANPGPGIQVSLLNLKDGSTGKTRSVHCHYLDSGSDTSTAVTGRHEGSPAEHCYARRLSPEPSERRRKKKRCPHHHQYNDDNSSYTSDTGSDTGSIDRHYLRQSSESSTSWNADRRPERHQPAQAQPKKTGLPGTSPSLERMSAHYKESTTPALGRLSPEQPTRQRRLLVHSESASFSAGRESSSPDNAISRQPHGPSAAGFASMKRFTD